jgi:peptidase M28-like protein
MNIVKKLKATSSASLILACFLILSGFNSGEAAPAVLPAVPSTVEVITPAELRMHLEFLASEELGGRYTLSPGFQIAARYLASHLEGYGFRGGGEHGSFMQTFDVIAAKPDMAKTFLEVTAGGKSSSFSLGEAPPFGSVGPADVRAQIVFAGYGVSSASQKQDDYAGLNVKGKIVLIVAGFPAGIDPSKLAADEQGSGAAKAHGAVGVLQVPTGRFAEFLKDKGAVERFAARESVRLAKEGEGRLPTMILGPDAADKLLTAAGLNAKAVNEAIGKKLAIQAKASDATAHMLISVQQSRQTTQNVVGILEGTDPKLRDEYVTFSAHYDHLKTSASGQIYPGADDDGSGTSAVLTIAHAMSVQRPKRSVMVVFHAGEELGLLGSEYNSDYAPAIALDKMVVDLNIDMIGRSKPNGDTQAEDQHLTDAHSVYLVGSNRISSELHGLSEDTNAEFQKLKLDYFYNDPANPERIYFRSDHWNYAKHGVPVIFYFDGVHVDYHKPTDTVDKIDFTKMTDITRLVFETGWRIANLDHRLTKTL